MTTFDYAAMDPETRIVVQQRTGEIKSLVRRSVADVIEIGAKLADVKSRLAHGQFGDWLEGEFGWSHDTAGRFMNVAAHFGQIPQIADFAAASALYLLASASTPDQARAEAVRQAEAGERITVAKAKVIIQQAQSTPGEITAALESWLATFASNRQRELALQDVRMNGADLYAALRVRLPHGATRNDVRRAAGALLPEVALKSAVNGVNGHGPEAVYIAPHAARRATPAAVRTKSPATKTAPDLSPEELRRSLIELLTLPATATNADILAAVGTLQAAFEVNHDL